MDTLRTELIETDEGFAALERDWSELLADSDADCAFLSWEWLSTWWRHFGQGRRLSILTVRRGDAVIAIAPLAVAPPRWRQCGTRVVEFLGSGDVGSDYLDVIIRRGHDASARRALIDAFEQRRLTISARGVPASRSEVAWLANGLSARGWRHTVLGREACPWIDLRGKTWDDYLATLGAEHRYNLRRRTRKLARQGATFETIGTDEDRRPTLDTLIRLHNARWEKRGGSTAFHAPALRAFHDDVTRLFLDRGWLRLHRIQIQGNTVAVLYGFLYNRRFNFYQAGFDERFASQSVGLVLMGHAIERAIADGADQYDLLHGEEPYKRLWARETRPLISVELYPPTFAGWLSRVGTTGRLVAKRVIRPRSEPARVFAPVSGVHSDRPGLAI